MPVWKSEIGKKELAPNIHSWRLKEAPAASKPLISARRETPMFPRYCFVSVDDVEALSLMITHILHVKKS